MPNGSFHLEHAIAAWRNSFGNTRSFSADDLEELERHLRDHVDMLVCEGHAEEDAFHHALRKVGDFGTTETEYRKVKWDKLKQEHIFKETLTWYGYMFSTYFKLAYRNLAKHKLASFINIAGLSIAIGCSFVAFLFIDFFYNRDTFHENADSIYAVHSIYRTGNQTQEWASSPIPLGPALAADLPAVSNVARVITGSGVLRYEDRTFSESIRFVDPAFLNMFSFPLSHGSSTALYDAGSIVLSSTLTEKYFGDVDPLGKDLTVRFSNGAQETFTVAAVAAPFPDRASFWFNALINFDHLRTLDVDLDDWATNTRTTFIQTDEHASLPEIEAQLASYLPAQHLANPERTIESFTLESLVTLARRAASIRDNITFLTMDPAQAINMAFSGLFLLLMACFNYINIAVVTATGRLREVGIRKVVGGNRLQLVTQFLGEHILLCIAALLLGTALGHFFLAPGFNSLFPVFNLALDLTENSLLWIYMAIVLGFTGIVGGLYPALYVSRFRPLALLRKQMFQGGKQRFTRTLLVFQFVLAFFAIVNIFVYFDNQTYQRDRDWGYTQTHRLVVPVNNNQQFELLKNELEALPGIERTSGTVHHVGRSRDRATVMVDDNPFEVATYRIGHDYFETLDVRLESGRFFDRTFPSDQHQSVIINVALAQKIGWDVAIDQTLRLDDAVLQVVGVIDNFMTNPMRTTDPAIFRLSDPQHARYVVAALQPGQALSTADQVEHIWKSNFADEPYRGYFQDSILDTFYSVMDNLAVVSLFSGFISLLITCMGIFGLVSLTLSKRLKEFSIRKVLGATPIHILSLLNRGFLIILAIALIVAVPMSYVGLDAMMGALFAEHTPLYASAFIWSTLIMIGTACLTVSSVWHKATRTNPAVILRQE